MKYRAGYKYQLAETEVFYTPIKPLKLIQSGFLTLTVAGTLTIRRGYAWDGPSGPTWDTKSTLRGSAFHDAIYQLLRMRCLSPEWREYADEHAGVIWKEDGMWWWRRKLWVREIKKFGAPAADPKNVKPILTAP